MSETGHNKFYQVVGGFLLIEATANLVAVFGFWLAGESGFAIGFAAFTVLTATAGLSFLRLAAPPSARRSIARSAGTR